MQTLLILLKLVIYKPAFLVSLENNLNSSKQEDYILKYLDRWWNHFCDRAGIAAKPKSEEGQGLVEYALILLLVVIVVIAILTFLGPQLGSMFSAVTKGLS